MGHDAGMLVIRSALGLMLVVHGGNKAFGPGGLGGTTAWFASLGLRPAWVHARLAAGLEIAAGAFLCLGLLTGPACAAYVGLMLVAALTDHRGKGYFVFKGGCEYVLLVGLVAVGIACVGPGAWSLDNALGIVTTGSWWPVAAVVAGAGAASGLLATSYRPPAATEGDAG